MTLQCVHSCFAAFTRSHCDRVIIFLPLFFSGLNFGVQGTDEGGGEGGGGFPSLSVSTPVAAALTQFLGLQFRFLCLKCLWLSDNTWERLDFTHVTAVHYSEPVRTRTVTTNKNRESRFGLAGRR